jgi:DNA-binding response OmpR family regulator
MPDNNRILIFGREQESTDVVTRILETAGFIVTGTLDEGVAIDLAGNSDYDILLIGREVSQSDQRYVATRSRNANPDLTVVVVQSTESVLTQLRQAGVYIR